MKFQKRLWIGIAGLAATGTVIAQSAQVVGPASAQKDPVIENATGAYEGVQVQDELSRRVTKQFQNATLSDVLAWLSLEGLSFVAETTEFGDTMRLTLNFANQPLKDVLNAISQVVGAKWEQRGSIFVLKPERRVAFAPSAPAVPILKDVPLIADAKAMEKWRAESEKMLAKAQDGRRFFVSPGFPSSPEAAAKMRAELETSLKNMPNVKFLEGKALDPKAAESVKLEIEKAMKELEKEHAAFKWSTSGHNFAPGQSDVKIFTSDPELTKKLQAQIEEMLKGVKELKGQFQFKLDPKEMGEAMKGFKFDGKSMKPLDPKMMEKLQKEIAESMKGLEGLKGLKGLDGMKFMPLDPKEMEKFHKEMGEAMKGFKFDGKTMKPLDPKEMEKFHKEMGEAMKGFKFDGKSMKPLDPKMMEKLQKEIAESMKGLEGLKGLKGLDGKMFVMPAPGKEWSGVPGFKKPSFVFEKANLEKLMKSLTPAQKQLMDKRGYLVPTDLTPSQIELIGELPMGKDWSISFSLNGQKLSIKSGN